MNDLAVLVVTLLPLVAFAAALYALIERYDSNPPSKIVMTAWRKRQRRRKISRMARIYAQLQRS